MAADHIAGLAFGGQQPHSPSEHVVDPNVTVLVIHSVKVSVLRHSFQCYTRKGGVRAALKSCERGPWDKPTCMFIHQKITFIFTIIIYVHIYTVYHNNIIIVYLYILVLYVHICLSVDHYHFHTYYYVLHTHMCMHIL